LGSIALTLLVVRRRGLVLCLAPIPGGLILIAYGFSTDVMLALGIMFAWGLSAAVFINMVTPLLQEASDPAMLGRVMSVSSLCFAIAVPLGLAQAAVISTIWSPEAALVTSGVVCTALGVLTALFLGPVKRLR
jgi:hypothetical protein